MEQNDQTVHPKLSLCVLALDVTTPFILDRIDAALPGSRFDGSRDAVKIALAEVLNNVVEHGYRCLPIGAVAIDLGARQDVLTIDVVDWGHAYPDHALPEGIAPEPEQMAEGGYGWFLIKTLMTNVTYERRFKSNRLSLQLAV